MARTKTFEINNNKRYDEAAGFYATFTLHEERYGIRALIKYWNSGEGGYLKAFIGFDPDTDTVYLSGPQINVTYPFPAPDFNDDDALISLAWDLIDLFPLHARSVKYVPDESTNEYYSCFEPKPRNRVRIAVDYENDADDFWSLDSKAYHIWYDATSEGKMGELYTSEDNARWFRAKFESLPGWSDSSYPKHAPHPILFYNADGTELD